MARKAKLDILEIQEDLPKEAQGTPSVEEEGAPLRPRAFKKGLFLAALGALALVIIGGIFLWWLAGPAEKGHSRQASQRPAMPPASREVLVLEDFYVPCQGPDGRLRIAVFGLAVEVNGKVEGPDADLRKAIYSLARKRGMSAWLLTEERWELKHVIAAELERRWGVGKVKEVYFTDVKLL